jgi:LysM repeat protein
MNENMDNEVKDFEGQIADELGYRQKDENIRRRKPVTAFRAPKKTLILAGAGIVVLIILIALFSGGDGKLSTGELTSIQVRVDKLEKKLTRLEGIEARIASLEKQEQRLVHSTADRAEKSLTQRLDTLTHRIDELEKTMASAPAKTEASHPSQKKPSPPDKVRYHEVRSGENLYRIALQYGITVDELCRLNKITPKQVIHPGQKLLVAPEGNQ